MPTAATTPRFVAFISYAREDIRFALRLKQQIEASTRPTRPGDAAAATPVRAFIDQENLTGTRYEESVKRHLGNSDTLIVVCSPFARQSPYVDREITDFVAQHKPDARILPVLVEGLADNEVEAHKAFPKALMSALARTPDDVVLGRDFRGLRPSEPFAEGRFEAEWYKLLADLYDAEVGTVKAEDQSRLARLRRQRQLRIGLAVAALVLLGTLLFWREFDHKAREKAIEKDIGDRSQRELADSELRFTALRDCVAQGRPDCLPKPGDGGANAPAAPGPAAAASAGTAPPTATTSTASAGSEAPGHSALKARLYMHVRVGEQRPLAEALKRAIERAGLGVVVPGIQQLPVGPSSGPELRYFKDAEAAQARQIQAALQRVPEGRDLVLRKVPGYENSTAIHEGHFELWFGPP